MDHYKSAASSPRARATASSAGHDLGAGAGWPRSRGRRVGRAQWAAPVRRTAPRRRDRRGASPEYPPDRPAGVETLAAQGSWREPARVVSLPTLALRRTPRLRTGVPPPTRSPRRGRRTEPAGHRSPRRQRSLWRPDPQGSGAKGAPRVFPPVRVVGVPVARRAACDFAREAGLMTMRRGG